MENFNHTLSLILHLSDNGRLATANLFANCGIPISSNYSLCLTLEEDVLHILKICDLDAHVWNNCNMSSIATGSFQHPLAKKFEALLFKSSI